MLLFRCTAARFLRLIGLAAIVVVPVQVFSTIVLLSAEPDRVGLNVFGNAQPQYDTKNTLVQLAGTLVGAVHHLRLERVRARRCAPGLWPTRTSGRRAPGSAARIGGRGFFAVLGTAILVALCEMVGFALCFVGYFAAIGFFAVAMPAAVLERFSPGRAPRPVAEPHEGAFLPRVRRGHRGDGADLDPGRRVDLGSRNPVPQQFRGAAAIIAQGCASAISATLTAPFHAAVAVVVYFDCRIRDEAFDVQLLMQRNDERYATAAPVA